MSAPPGWDEKSWNDVSVTADVLLTFAKTLRERVGADQPDAGVIHALLEDIAQAASAGALAASWCLE